MKTEAIAIVDRGRGPQFDGHRLTVMDVFYYLHRGHDFDFIHRAMPSLTREQFDAVVAYVHDHHDELAEQDRLVEERIKQGIAEQKAKGLYRDIDDSVPAADRAVRLTAKLRQHPKDHAEKNGGPTAR